MKLLSFSHDSQLLGAQRSLLALLSGLKEAGHDVHLVLPAHCGLSEAAGNLGIKTTIVSYPYPSSKPLKALRYLLEFNKASTRINQLVIEEKPDIVHFNTAACIAPAMALRKVKLNKIWHLREKAPQRGLISRWVSAWSTIAVANCRDTMDGYPALKESGKITLVYNGISIKKVAPEAVARLRAELGWEPQKPVILFAGNLLPHKNPSALLEAAKHFKKQQLEAKFYIIGEGELKPHLEQQRINFALEDYIEIAGFKTNAIDYIAAADIIVIPSLVEPFPRTGLEAMSMGKPVVATSVGGMAEQIIHQQTGYLYSPETESEFFSHLERLVLDKALRKQFGDAGLARVKAEFSQEAYTSSFLKVCFSLTGLPEE